MDCSPSRIFHPWANTLPSEPQGSQVLKNCLSQPLSPKISPQRGAPVQEVLQYQVNAWSGRKKLLFQLPVPKIHLICCPQIEDVSDIKLIRKDTTLDLSQKAEKRCWITSRRCYRPAVLHVTLSVTRVPAHSRSPCLCFVDTTVNGTVLDSRADFLFSTL